MHQSYVKENLGGGAGISTNSNMRIFAQGMKAQGAEQNHDHMSKKTIGLRGDDFYQYQRCKSLHSTRKSHARNKIAIESETFEMITESVEPINITQSNRKIYGI